MNRKQWIGVTLVTVLGAGTILEGQHFGNAIPPHVEVNLPPPPPQFQQTVAVTGSGSLSINAHDVVAPTDHLIATTVFTIKM